MGDEQVHLLHAQDVTLLQPAFGDADVVIGCRVVPAEVGAHRALHDEGEHGNAVACGLGRKAPVDEVRNELLDVHVVDVRHATTLEIGTNVALQDAPVATAGRWSKSHGCGPPPISPFLEKNAGEFGVDPGATAEIAADVVEELRALPPFG